MKLEKLIQKKINRLNYINKRDEIIERTKQYNQEHAEEVKKRKREWNAFTGLLKMNGLCHGCFCSNVEIFNHKGHILCDGCVEKYNDEQK